jgi:hypothetical protein
MVASSTAATASEQRAPSAKTRVSIAGTNFRINGKVTYPGARARGLLLNSRMVQAIYDDENPQTVARWAYPDTRRWDPRRNTREFIAALPSYAASGLRAVTISLQGGSPRNEDRFRGNQQAGIVSAFRADGSLKPAWRARADAVIRACDARGIVVVLDLFYFGQDERLKTDAAVVRAVDLVVAWMMKRRYRNVLIEVANEADNHFDHANLRPENIERLIRRVRTRSKGTLLASTSFTSRFMPPEDVIRASDFVLLHANELSVGQLQDLINRVRSLEAYLRQPKPIVINEDGTNFHNMEAAIRAHVSWGDYQQGENDYQNGFQSPPVNWTINTPKKRTFFEFVRYFAGKRKSPPPHQR